MCAIYYFTHEARPACVHFPHTAFPSAGNRTTGKSAVEMPFKSQQAVVLPWNAQDVGTIRVGITAALESTCCC